MVAKGTPIECTWTSPKLLVMDSSNYDEVDFDFHGRAFKIYHVRMQAQTTGLAVTQANATMNFYIPQAPASVGFVQLMNTEFPAGTPWAGIYPLVQSQMDTCMTFPAGSSVQMTNGQGPGIKQVVLGWVVFDYTEG